MIDIDQLVELGDAPEIYADGIAAVYITGEMARVVLYSWRRLGGVFRPVTVATIVRPVSSLEGFDRMTAAAKRIELETSVARH